MTIRKQILIGGLLMILLPLIFMVCMTVLLFIIGILSVGGNIFEISDEFSWTFRYMLLFSGGSLVIMLVTMPVSVIILSNKILTPIKRLTSAAYSIKNGNFDFEIMGTECSEIDELCYAFDCMRLQLNESRKLREKDLINRRIMIANISHDIKTPLTSIKGYISGIKDGVASSPEKMMKYIDIIYKKAEIIENMINNMIDLSVMEMSKESFNFEYGGIIPFITSVAEEYEENKYADISLDLPDKDVMVRIDYVKMRRVLCNLIDNSIKYRNGSKCSIVIEMKEDKSGVVISVSDDGIGIRGGDINRVFDVFYRSDPSRTPNIKGTGLGLAIAREIVENHGGRIWMKNGENAGLNVYIFLKKI